MNLSPLDDRYRSKVESLLPIFSEFGLMKYRTIVEIKWLIFLSEENIAPDIPFEVKVGLESLCNNFTEVEYDCIKKHESVTNHDVKAVEYFIRDLVPQKLWSWIHFGCTSEDINNTAYGLMLKDGVSTLNLQKGVIVDDLSMKSKHWKNIPMLCRTHGQTATPSTLGKEMAIFYQRINRLSTDFNVSYTAKFSGATGTWSAHTVAFPDLNWLEISERFVESNLGLTFNPLTSQIEPHDFQAQILNQIILEANVLIDLARDIWGYIALGYFGQKTVAGEVGSSTMPHKVNPIDFENAEGNLKLARGIARTLADELPISRWQRDLTDSTLQRNFGLVFGHMMLALKSLEKGLGKLEVRKDVILNDLNNAPEVLTEAVQMVLRAHGYHDAYEQLKNFSRGQVLNLEQVYEFIGQTDLPDSVKKKLSKLTPENYTGLAEKLVVDFVV